MKNYLNFETEIKDLEKELDKLKDPYNQSGLSEVDTQKISETQEELDQRLKTIYTNLLELLHLLTKLWDYLDIQDRRK